MCRQPDCPGPKYTPGGARCIECGKRAMGRHLCPNHYKQWQYRQNPAKYRAWESERRRRYPEHMQGIERGRYLRDRTKIIRRVAIAKARRKSAVGTLTVAQVEARFAYWGNRCWMCGGEPETIDHTIPLSRGGTNWPANIRPACRSCNSRRGNRPIAA